MEVCSAGRRDMLQLLIESGADINAEDQCGQIALFYASRRRKAQSAWSPRLNVAPYHDCVSALEVAAAEAAAVVQLITLHAAAPNDEGSVTVLATSLGGDELAQVRVELAMTMESIVAELQVGLSPREQRFMSPSGRIPQHS